MGRQIFTIVSFITFQLMILAGQADAGVPTVPAPPAIVLIGVGAAAVGLIAWWRGSRK